jgi:hypothetical protein
MSKEGTSDQPLRDFEFARQELAAKQNSRFGTRNFVAAISHCSYM